MKKHSQAEPYQEDIPFPKATHYIIVAFKMHAKIYVLDIVPLNRV